MFVSRVELVTVADVSGCLLWWVRFLASKRTRSVARGLFGRKKERKKKKRKEKENKKRLQYTQQLHNLYINLLVTII